jgi:hypothetical protein
VAVGAAYCLVQTAAYYGYIQVNWRLIQRDTKMILDLDRDGEVSKKDLSVLFRRTMDVLTFNLPASAGFSGGFLFAMTGHGTSSLSLTSAGLGAHLLSRLALGGVALPGAPVALAWLGETLGLTRDPSDEDIRKMSKAMDPHCRESVRSELVSRRETAVSESRQKRLDQLIELVDDLTAKEAYDRWQSRPFWWRWLSRPV